MTTLTDAPPTTEPAAAPAPPDVLPAIRAAHDDVERLERAAVDLLSKSLDGRFLSNAYFEHLRDLIGELADAKASLDGAWSEFRQAEHQAASRARQAREAASLVANDAPAATAG